ncbi:MAG: hypothetical protein ACLFWL_17655 [Candidatus Brocadiia bacterium]
MAVSYMCWTNIVFAPRRISQTASGGVLFLGNDAMPPEPNEKEAIAFIDGQNLFHSAKEAFGQDQDLSEVADEVKQISMDQGRWIKVACAFPCSPTSRNTRGINGTDWIKISRDVYDACLDPTDYRQKK